MDLRPAPPLRWVLLVTQGMSMAYPAELYADERVAEREGERWAWTLSEHGRMSIDRPFHGRWEVGEFWVRLVAAPQDREAAEVWVGTFWTRHGFPDPEAELFTDQEEARAWALAPGVGRTLSDVYETPWLVAATFKVGDDEEDAVVQLAKVVS